MSAMETCIKDALRYEAAALSVLQQLDAQAPSKSMESAATCALTHAMLAVHNDLLALISLLRKD